MINFNLIEKAFVLNHRKNFLDWFNEHLHLFFVSQTELKVKMCLMLAIIKTKWNFVWVHFTVEKLFTVKNKPKLTVAFSTPILNLFCSQKMHNFFFDLNSLELSFDFWFDSKLTIHWLFIHYWVQTYLWQVVSNSEKNSCREQILFNCKVLQGMNDGKVSFKSNWKGHVDWPCASNMKSPVGKRDEVNRHIVAVPKDDSGSKFNFKVTSKKDRNRGVEGCLLHCQQFLTLSIQMILSQINGFFLHISSLKSFWCKEF